MIRRMLAIGLVMALSGSVFAGQISIKNASFEEPVLDPGGWTNDYPDWSPPPAAADAFVEHIPGFSSEGVNHIGIATGEEVSQDLGVALMPNMTYDLTVAIGNRNANFTPGDNQSRFGLYVGGDVLDGGILIADQGYNASLIPEGTFLDQSLSVTTGDVVPAGNLFVSLRSTGGGRGHFDDIRLQAVPEPSALALAMLGLVGMFSQRFRRR